MKTITKTLLFFLILSLNIFADSSNIKAYAIGIFNEKGNGENIQHLRSSNNDYNGTCFSKIVVFGEVGSKSLQVKIGNSIGHFIKKIPVYNEKKIKIAEEMTFKHYNISKGYFQIKIDNKTTDTKVFIK